jgi:hypothetical protein
MIKLKEISKGNAARFGRFSITCLGTKTEVRPGDELTFLGDRGSSNIILGRRLPDNGVKGMGILSNQGESILGGMKKVFNEEEAQLIAIVLAASAGLSLEREDLPNSAVGRKNITYRFVA